ncbi:serine/threonine-protein kinase [Cryobacterium sp. PAMC25264]|uniref:serine/threonine-protein kinase n=1 Tax=Cryobacterium sp. PAMC25264 TaxID=2861288 RepID=UPI001C639BBC|nr:serine/threonine-protein kinase [Cryobacterium sp. PAMC25264]QYF74079.1 serine/threonine protein kinase [Cryobacterium sp. PAMC25264]
MRQELLSIRCSPPSWRPSLSAPTEPLRDESRSDSLIGLTLADRFTLDRLIGTGGMATVYQATDVSLGRTVAVKLFRMDTADGSGPQRQSGEVMVLASLNHFALVTLFDAGTEQLDGVTRSFIVMEYVDGFDLRSRIADGKLPAAEVARMGADLAEALHYVHARGIIHRDIKPANVLLAPSDFPGRVSHAKLADFGIARLIDATRLTSTGAVLGTAGYLSPEQAMGHPIGPPSDVYSLGLVLLEAVTGVRSYPGTAIESAMARLQRQPEIPAELGAAWHDVLTGMTSREPGDRLTSADAAVRLRDLVPQGTFEAGESSWIPAPSDAANDTATDAATELLQPTEAADAQTRRLPAGDEATRVLLAAGAADTGAVTVRLTPPAADHRPKGAAPARRTRPEPRALLPSAARRPLLVIIGAVVALAAVFALVFLVQPGDPAPEPPAYPAVDGDLGTHLQQLQESVTP